MSIIGFTGTKGSGKDTAAGALPGAVTVKMADGLKAMLRALLTYRGAPAELIERMLEGDLKEVPTPYLSGRTPRHAMVTLGTEWGRVCMGEDFWVDGTGDRCDALLAEGRDVKVTDIRFPNEPGVVRKRGGKVLRIVRPGYEAAEDAHASEALIATLDVDGEIVNDSTVEALHVKVWESLDFIPF